MINDKEFLKFEEGFFKPYFEKFIEFKRGKGEKVANSTLIRFRKLNHARHGRLRRDENDAQRH